MARSHKTMRAGLVVEDLSTWPEPAEAGLDETDAADYRRYREAVELYASNDVPLKEIERRTGVARPQLRQLVIRCLRKHADARIFGFRALVPHTRTIEYGSGQTDAKPERAARAWAFIALLKAHPTTAKEMFMLAIYGHEKHGEPREIDIPVSVLRKRFVDKLLAAGVKAPAYPFNTESEGRPAFGRWVAKIRAEHLLKKLRAEGGNHHKLGGPPSDLPEAIRRLFRRVEIDGYRIDLHATITLPSPTGDGFVLKKISRLWIIAAVETQSSAAIGYSHSLSENYSAADVVRALLNCLRPWQRRTLTVKGVEYREGDGIPSGLFPEAAYLCFDELHLDHAKAHLARHAIDFVARTINAVPAFDAVGDPDSRAHIEAFFGLLAEAGIHRMPGTTGSGPDDRRRAQQGEDLRYHLTEELLLDLIDLVVCRINGARAPGNSLTRNEVLANDLQRRKTLLRRLPAALRHKHLDFDLWIVKRIGTDHGRPCVRFESARYFSDVLSTRRTDIGKPVLIMANSRKMRRVECVLNGESLGELLVEPRYRGAEHDLTTRRQIAKLVKQGLIAETDDLVAGFRAHLSSEAHTSRVAAAQLQRLNEGDDSAAAAFAARKDVKDANVPPPNVEAVPHAVDSKGALNDIIERMGSRYRR